MLNFFNHVPALNPSDALGSSSSVPQRSEIDAAYKWRLTDLYADDAAFYTAKSAFEQAMPSLTAFRGSLNSAQALADCLEMQDSLSIAAGRLFAYARMNRDSDAGDSNYQAMTSQMEGLLAQFSQDASFIEPEILSLDEQELTKWLTAEPRLKTFQHYLSELLRQKEHILSPAEEALLSGMAEIRQAPATIYTMLTNADLTFPLTPEENGQLTELSEGRYNGLIRSRDLNVRRSAFTNLFSTYAKYRHTFAASYAATLKNAAFTARARKYDSALAASLENSHIPTAVYDNLIAATHANLAPLHRYVSLKKRALELDEIHMYDLYVPLTDKEPAEYPYENALQLVFDGLKPLGETYISDLQAATAEKWLDVYENQGKRTGAYSWGVYGVHPFVLLNYDKKYGSVSTIAHELGHSMHSYYSSRAQAYINSEYTIFCAEVASTTNEILLLHNMLTNEADEQIKLFFINQHLEQVRTTVYRQVLFAEFEKITHARIGAGEALTADYLEKLWLDLNRQYYGNDIIVDDLIKIEWARIPHFYRPFYVYQYATGYAAASALASQLLNEGESARQRYLGYLSGGCSKDSLDLLKDAGVDMTTPQPIEATLQAFASSLTQLEKLLK